MLCIILYAKYAYYTCICILYKLQNGLEATKTLRQAGYPYLIIGVTGNVLDDDIKEYLQAGADMVIGKTLRMDLLDKLLMHIQSHDCTSMYHIGYKLMETDQMIEWSFIQIIEYQFRKRYNLSLITIQNLDLIKRKQNIEVSIYVLKDIQQISYIITLQVNLFRSITFVFD